MGRPSGLGGRLSIDGADKLVQLPEAAYGTLDPVPQKARCVCAGLNAGNIMQGQWPKATDVSPWYGVDPDGVVLLPAQGEWKFPVKFGTPILIIRHTIYLFWDLTPNLRIYDHSQEITSPPFLALSL